MEILVEFGALCGVYLRAVLLDIAYGQSVEADRLSFLFFKVSRELLRFPACQVVVDFEFTPAVRAHDSLGAIAIDVFAKSLDWRSQRSSDRGCSNQCN